MSVFAKYPFELIEPLHHLSHLPLLLFAFGGFYQTSRMAFGLPYRTLPRQLFLCTFEVLLQRLLRLQKPPIKYKGLCR